MIGFIGALSFEIENFRLLMEDKKEYQISGIKFVTGKLGRNEVVTAVCGIGKVFAAICTEAMITKFNPDVIINTGVAGSLDDKLNILDVVVAKKVVQHDMDTSPLGDPKGLLSGINVIYIDTDDKVSNLLYECVKAENINTVTGTIASGDQFISSKEKKEWIKKEFNASACEMEAASIGHVCYVNNMPFGILRAISDSANDEANMDYMTFAEKAAKGYVKVVERFCNEYGK